MATDRILPSSHSMLVRSLGHILFVLLLMAAGAYAFSFHVFLPFFPEEKPPVALAVGMSLFLVLAAIPSLAGIGLRALTEIFVRRGAAKPLSPTTLFDLLAFTQYLTVAILLWVLHFIAR